MEEFLAVCSSSWRHLAVPVKMALSVGSVREQEQGPGSAAQKVEVARGQCCEGVDAADMKTQQVEDDVQNVEVEDDAGKVL